MCAPPATTRWRSCDASEPASLEQPAVAWWPQELFRTPVMRHHVQLPLPRRFVPRRCSCRRLVRVVFVLSTRAAPALLFFPSLHCTHRACSTVQALRLALGRPGKMALPLGSPSASASSRISRSSSVSAQRPLAPLLLRPAGLQPSPLRSPSGLIAAQPPASPSPRTTRCRAAQPQQQETENQPALVGEDAAAFDLQKQSATSWALFTVLLSGVLGMLYLVRPRMPRACPSSSMQHASSRTMPTPHHDAPIIA